MIVEHVREVKQGQPCSVGTVVERTQEVMVYLDNLKVSAADALKIQEVIHGQAK